MTSSRREIRIIVIQTLFENDFKKVEPDYQNLLSIFNRIAKERSPEFVDTAFAKKLLEGIASKQKEIDNIIDQASPNWTLDKIGSVDKNILRLGVFELLFGNEFDVPGRVALNEAIEITKVFLNKNATKFVNGVLGAVYLGVKDEDEALNKKPKTLSKKFVGGVVFRIDEANRPKFAFVHDVFGKWTLSKGGLVEGETNEDGFKRNIKEEIGVDVQQLGVIGSNSYVAHLPDGTVRKEVTYMLGKTNDEALFLKETDGLVDVKWFSFDNAKTLQFYPDLKQIILDGMQKAVEQVANKQV